MAKFVSWDQGGERTRFTVGLVRVRSPTCCAPAGFCCPSPRAFAVAVPRSALCVGPVTARMV